MNEEEIIIYLTNQNKKLKEEICSLKNKIKEIDNTRAYWHIKNDDKKDKIKQLKEVIEEVKEYIKDNLFDDDNGCGCWWQQFGDYKDAKGELLQILDKVKEDR